MQYIEIALGEFTNRGQRIPLEQLGKWLTTAQQLNQPLYRSYYTFDEELNEHFKVYKTIKSFKGTYYLDQIIFDVDKGDYSKRILLERARVFVNDLMDNWKLEEGNMKLWFSGTGYHVSIPNIFDFEPGKDLPRIVKATLNKYFPEVDDIYDGARLLRVGYTVNTKSGLYKTPLSLEELNHLSADDIEEMAKTIRQGFKFVKEDDYPKFKPYIVKPTETVEKIKASESTRVVTCMQKCYDQGEEKGSRHIRILRMVSAFRRAGVPQSGVELLMREYAKSMEPYEVKRLVNDSFEAGYPFSCKDKVMREFCDPKCLFYKEKNYSPEILTAGDMEKSYVDFIRGDFEDSSIDLSDFYDMRPYKMYPKEFIVVEGDTGLGKTAWVQNIATYAHWMPSLYLSLEVGQELLYRRFIQIKHNMTKEAVENHYRQFNNTLSHGIDHIRVLTVPPDISTIERIIIEANVKLVVIDTIEDIIVQGKQDPLDEIGKNLKRIANRLNLIIIGVHHISKHAAQDEKGASKSLTVHSGKGASAVEQKADKVIGIEGNRDKDLRKLISLKGRDENPFNLFFRFKTDTFRFNQIQRVS